MTVIHVAPQWWMKADSSEEALEQQQASFYSTLTGLFQSQFSAQQGTLNFLQNSLEPLIQNPQGYSATDLTAMRSGATDTISTQFQNAQKALQQQNYVSGGRVTPSGVGNQEQTELDAAQASTNAGAQNQITQANEALKLSNYWNAISALSGVGGMQNPSYLLSGANQAGSSAFQSAQTINAQNNQWQNIVGGLAGGVLSGLGSASSFLNTSGNGFLNAIGGIL